MYMETMYLISLRKIRKKKCVNGVKVTRKETFSPFYHHNPNAATRRVLPPGLFEQTLIQRSYCLLFTVAAPPLGATVIYVCGRERRACSTRTTNSDALERGKGGREGESRSLVCSSPQSM